MNASLLGKSERFRAKDARLIGLLLSVVASGLCVGGRLIASEIASTPHPPPLQSYFTESARFAERLSPDGTHVACLGPDKDGINRLWVIAVDSPEIPSLVSPDKGPAVEAFFWIGPDRLLWQCVEGGSLRLFERNLHQPRHHEILPGERRVMTLEGVVNFGTPCILIGLSNEPCAFPDLYRVGLDGDAGPVFVCKNPHRIVTWAWGRSGALVAGLRWTSDGAKEILRMNDGLATVIFRAEPDDDARLLCATGDGSAVLVLTNRDADLTRLERIDLTTGSREVLATDPLGKVDVEEVFLGAGGNEPVATSYCDDTRRWRSEDPGFMMMLEEVRRKLEPLSMGCQGVDRTATRYLLRFSSDREPGMVCLYDVAGRSLSLLWREKPEMERAGLCVTKSLEYRASDGMVVPAYLTLPNTGKAPRPLVVFPHGGPRMRTFPGYDGRVQFLASRGYAVLQPNFRGSRGYGKGFMNAGDRQWGRGVMQTDVTDGVDHLVRTGVADKSRVAIMGGSYGGYAALAGLTFTPDRYAAAICLFGISDLPAFATHSPIEWQAFSGDTVRRLGDPTTSAGRAALEDLSPVNHAGEAQAPLLIYHGARDHLIPMVHASEMVRVMRKSGKQVEYLLAPDEDHGFSRPESEMAVYRAIEIFLHQHLGGTIGPTPPAVINSRLAAFRQAGMADPGQ